MKDPKAIAAARKYIEEKYQATERDWPFQAKGEMQAYIDGRLSRANPEPSAEMEKRREHERLSALDIHSRAFNAGEHAQTEALRKELGDAVRHLRDGIATLEANGTPTISEEIESFSRAERILDAILDGGKK